MKYTLLLLDANIVIYLFQLGLWKTITERCEIHLTRGVVGECDFYTDQKGQRHNIDLTTYETSRSIVVHDVPLYKVSVLKAKFNGNILDRLDPGEAESLAHLTDSIEETYKICSGDGIVHRVLGALRLSDQGVSLETIFKDVGLTRPVEEQYGEQRRRYLSQQGFTEGLTGISLS